MMESKDLSVEILSKLEQKDGLSSLDLANELGEDHQKIVGTIMSLQSLGNVIKTEQHSQPKLEVTNEGKLIIQKGSHEATVFNKVPKSGILMHNLLPQENDEMRLGFNKAVQNGWLKVVKNQDGTAVSRLVDKIVDQTQLNLVTLQENLKKLDEDVIMDLKKRKLVIATNTSYFVIWRSTDFSTSIVKQEAELTMDLLANGEYEKRTFKPYNFDAMGSQICGGHLHPLLKVRTEFLQILTEMGFSEMPTNRFVESSFWNFDALFVPQKHPARDVQDTFFLSRPQHCNTLPEEYKERVKRMHSHGEYGSTGYKMEWKEDEAVKNVMRTHTTAVSARVLYELAQNKPFKPIKKFSIDRVFRNETLDATHLAEFHQVEGFVADKGLSLGHLIGVMTEFFRRLGIDQLRFKPAYNPYTEPSMEVFAYHKGLKKWVEVGNSGVFRPEMLLPMGLPEDVRVIAWGLSLERPTMIRYGIDNIRSLVGHRVDLRMVYNNALCRLDKV